MAHIEERPRKNGSVTYYVRWIDPDSKSRMTQKMESKESAELLLTVLKAHGSDVGAALKSTKEHFSGVYTVTRMIEEHIDLLTSASGYTVRRYKGSLRCHVADSLGVMEATSVEYRDIVWWLKEMQDKGLSSKRIANVHGLISAAFNTCVREKRRTDNPCKGISLPKSNDTDEKATFLTENEWGLVSAELTEPYKSFFTFLIRTGLRFSEATALEAKDFVTTPTGQLVVKVVRAWTKDEDNVPYIGPPKTKQSKRSVALPESAEKDTWPLIAAAGRAGGTSS